MRHLRTNKVFFSAERADATLEVNDAAHAKAIEMLRREGIGYRVLTGFWKGISERSILLESTDVRDHATHVSVALSAARLFNQEAILEVHNDDSAELHKIDQEFPYTERLGVWRIAGQEEAISRDSYTFDQETGRYYVVDA